MNREIDDDCCEAPSLAQLVQDPLIGLMMRSDGVDRRSIELLFERLARERPRAARQPAAALAGDRCRSKGQHRESVPRVPLS
ncbi:MAG TPA: hypothetical protein VGM07_05920 [Stellaceae bacterium]